MPLRDDVKIKTFSLPLSNTDSIQRYKIAFRSEQTEFLSLDVDVEDDDDTPPAEECELDVEPDDEEDVEEEEYVSDNET